MAHISSDTMITACSCVQQSSNGQLYSLVKDDKGTSVYIYTLVINVRSNH